MKRKITRFKEQREEIIKLKKELNELKSLTKKEMLTLITSSLGFVTALFWRDAFKAALEQIIGVAPGFGPWTVQVGLAVLVTIITVTILFSLMKTLGKVK